MRDETAELAEQANEIFDRVIRPQVDVEEDAHKYVAINTESEDFEIDADQRAASDRLLERHPEARGVHLLSSRRQSLRPSLRGRTAGGKCLYSALGF